MFNFIKKIFKSKTPVGNFFGYEPTEQKVDIEIGDKLGFIGSSHGNIIALEKITDILVNQYDVKYIFLAGDIMDEHAGYIECLEYSINHPKILPIVGNHDLLIVFEDKIHNYEKEYLTLASKAFKRIKQRPDLMEALMKMPAIIQTPYFTVVHESVKYPYYAKITKLKKKSYEYGKTPDENLEAIFNSTLRHPYFTGSDHQAYIIEGVMLKKRFMKPNETVELSGSKLISLPSVSLSKDSNYTHGYVYGEILKNKSIKLTFLDLPDLLIDAKII